MANICTISMKIYGTDENCKKFVDALTQNGTTFMGRGAELDADPTIYELPNDMRVYVIDGWVKWSIFGALIRNAIDMRENPSKWLFEVDPTTLTFITLIDACEQFKVCCEAWSVDEGNELSEHYYIDDNGKILVNETLDEGIEPDQFLFEYVWDDCGLLK